MPDGDPPRPSQHGKPRAPTTLDPTGEFPFDLPTYLFHLFAVLSRHRDQQLEEALAPLGLNPALHRAMGVIGRIEPCTMTRLADMTAVDRTTMTRTVDHLVADGLVDRSTPPTDRRQVVLHLTASGREVLSQALRVIYRLNRSILEGIDDEGRRAFIRAERTMLDKLIPDETLRRRLFELDREDDASG